MEDFGGAEKAVNTGSANSISTETPDAAIE